MGVTSYTRKGIVGVRFEPGGSTQVAQIGAPASLTGKSISAGTGTGATAVVLPVFGSDRPFAALDLAALEVDIYYALGDSSVAVTTTDAEFDSIVLVGMLRTIATRDATHIAVVTASGSGTLVINGVT